MCRLGLYLRRLPENLPRIYADDRGSKEIANIAKIAGIAKIEKSKPYPG
jgi:hypothetical protein